MCRRDNLLEVVCVREAGILDDLQVVTGYQAGTSGGGRDFGLPPSIILKSNDREDIALGEAQFFRDGCRVAVHCTRY